MSVANTTSGTGKLQDYRNSDDLTKTELETGLKYKQYSEAQKRVKGMNEKKKQKKKQKHLKQGRG